MDSRVGALTGEALGGLAAAYPLQQVRLAHDLGNHPLFSLTKLAEAAKQLAPSCIEIRASDNRHGGAFPRDRTSNASRAILDIANAQRWVLLRDLDKLPAYGALIEALLRPVEQLVADRTGPPLRRRSFLFVSSPGLLTPLHFDPEYNIFFQIAGAKTFAILPPREPWIDEDAIPRFRSSGDNLVSCTEGIEGEGTIHQVGPGDALYVPYCSPHWVRVDAEPSVSLSLTWTTQWALRDEYSRIALAAARRLRLPVPKPRPWPITSWPQALAGKVVARMGLLT